MLFGLKGLNFVGLPISWLSLLRMEKWLDQALELFGIGAFQLPL